LHNGQMNAAKTGADPDAGRRVWRLIPSGHP
jgi:hypothetical protein